MRQHVLVLEQLLLALDLDVCEANQLSWIELLDLSWLLTPDRRRILCASIDDSILQFFLGILGIDLLLLHLWLNHHLCWLHWWHHLVVHLLLEDLGLHHLLVGDWAVEHRAHRLLALHLLDVAHVVVLCVDAAAVAGGGHDGAVPQHVVVEFKIGLLDGFLLV